VREAEIRVRCDQRFDALRREVELVGLDGLQHAGESPFRTGA